LKLAAGCTLIRRLRDRVVAAAWAGHMMLHGIGSPAIDGMDSLSQDHAANRGRYTVVLTNPPFKDSLNYDEVAKDSPGKFEGAQPYQERATPSPGYPRTDEPPGKPAVFAVLNRMNWCLHDDWPWDTLNHREETPMTGKNTGRHRIGLSFRWIAALALLPCGAAFAQDDPQGGATPPAAAWLVRPEQTEPRILRWAEQFPDLVVLDKRPTLGGHTAYAVPVDQSKSGDAARPRLVFAQPHAHEPATTAGIIREVRHRHAWPIRCLQGV